MIKHIHFVGIKGVGMAPLAILAKEAGFKVTGSDIAEQFITDISLQQAGIIPFVGFASEHVDSADLVITTGAHGGYNNFEVVSAKDKGIHVISQGEAVGLFMQGTLFDRKFTGVSVAGTHGKTTTTAMIATVLKEAKKDPTYIIGTSQIPSLGNAGHYGKGNYFIAEADEYATEPIYDKKPKFLWQNPKIIVITNIDYDHPDVYSNLDAFREACLQFVNQLPIDGLLITYGDDREVQNLLKKFGGRVITYGFSTKNNYILSKIHPSGDNTFIQVKSSDLFLGEFMLKVSGKHNCLNALAAIIVGLETGLTSEQIRAGLLTFTGAKRRMEYHGELTTGAVFYDDYAHHPTEIRNVLFALHEKYPKKKIICIFQPHTYSRTKALFQDFIHAFSDADTVVLTDIYPSSREKSDETISSIILAQSIKQYHGKVVVLSSIEDVVEYLDKNQFGQDKVIVTMGAGDIYKVILQMNFK